MTGQPERRLQELQELLPDVDRDLQRFFPFTVEKVSATGDASDLPGTYFVRGLASVYNSWSLDLGGFKERILPGAFDEVLTSDPHVLHVWDHDTSKTLSSTRNGTLELKSVDAGLQYYSKVAPTSYAHDLRILLERGDIDQSSFAFTVDEQEWRIIEDANDQTLIERDIVKVSGLFDVTTCAMGAYPMTEAALAVRSLLKKPRAASFLVGGLVPQTTATSVAGMTFVPAERTVAPAEPDEPVGEPEPVEPDAGGEPESQEPLGDGTDSPPSDEEERATRLEQLKAEVREAAQSTRNRVFNVDQED